MSSTVEGRNAIVYGAAGGLGSGVSRAFARDGARVHLVGRTEAPLRALADEITAAGGRAEVAVLDALDEAAVDAHAGAVVGEHGSIDVSFNLIMRGDVQGIPLVDMSVEDLLRAPTAGLRTAFLTARAAARQMITQGSGVILHLNSGSGAESAPGMGSTGPADAASEAFYRYLAREVGAAGVRVCGIWTAAVIDTLTVEKLRSVSAHAPEPDVVAQAISGMSALRRPPVSAEVAEVAAFLASDRASGMTGTMVNVSSGLMLK